MRLSAFDHWQDHAYKNNDAYQRLEKSKIQKLGLEPALVRFVRKAASGWTDKQVAGNRSFKKMLNDQRKYQTDTQVCFLTRSCPDNHQGIGKNQE